MFDHERLEVYRAAIDLVAFADDIADQLPRGRGKLADQLSRASISIPLNIAEGAGRYGQKEKQQAYRVARGSAMESAAIVDVCVRLNLVSAEQSRSAKDLLLRIVSMLTKLILSLE